MNKFLSGFAKVMGYVPYLAAGVLAAEQVAQGEPGASKLQLAVDVANAVAPVAEQAVPTAAPAIDAANSEVKLVVSAIVAAMNIKGLFTHSTPAPAKA